MAQFERDIDDDEGSDGVTPFSANSDSKTNSNGAPNHARLQSRRSSVLSEVRFTEEEQSNSSPDNTP